MADIVSDRIIIPIETNAEGAALEISKLNSVMGKLDGTLDKMSSSMDKSASATKDQASVFGMLKKAIPIATIAYVGKTVLNMGSAMLKATGESQANLAQLNATLKSTGYAAGLTSDELVNLADKFFNVTQFEDDAIIRSEALLLTFTKIGKDVFPRAQAAVLDLAAAMGTDLQSATLQMGKALQDPVSGVTALGRAGVQLSDSQKELIKNMVAVGDVAGAQKIILKEVETQIGGVAEAVFKSNPMFAIEKLQQRLGNMVELFGTALTPAIYDFATALGTSAGEGGNLAQALQFIGRVAGSIIIILKSLGQQLFASINTYAGDAGKNLDYLKARISAMMSGDLKKVAELDRNYRLDTEKRIGQAQKDNVDAQLKSLDALGKTWGKPTAGAGGGAPGGGAGAGAGSAQTGGGGAGGAESFAAWYQSYATSAAQMNMTAEQSALAMSASYQNAYTSILAAQTAFNEQAGLLDQARIQALNSTVQQYGQAFTNVGGVLQAFGAYQAALDAAEIERMRAKGASQEDIAKREKKLARERAAYMKKVSLFQAIISTALAVTNGLATAPFFPLGIAMGILAGIKGAIEIATISKTPLPAAQFGGTFTVPTGAVADSGLLRVNQGEEVSVKPVRESNTNTSSNDIKVLRIGERDFDAYLVEKMNFYLNSGAVQSRRGGVIKAAR